MNRDDTIEPLLESATVSFGFTALNELQRLYNGKSLVEDGQFAIDPIQKQEYESRFWDLATYSFWHQ